MRPKFIPVLEMCIQDGIQAGWRHAHKHTDNPDEEKIFADIEYAIESKLYEWFHFDEVPYE